MNDIHFYNIFIITISWLKVNKNTLWKKEAPFSGASAWDTEKSLFILEREFDFSEECISVFIGGNIFTGEVFNIGDDVFS